MLLSLGFISFGVIWVILTLLFKSRINSMYENIKGLDEKQKKFYQKFAIKLPGIVFIIVGIYVYVTSFQDIEEAIVNVNWNLIIGCFALGFGIFSLIIRLLKQESKFFGKYNAMIEKWGKTKGMLLHIISYTLVPLIVGILFLIGN